MYICIFVSFICKCIYNVYSTTHIRYYLYDKVSREFKKRVPSAKKINYEANNDSNLTKLTTHCLDLYQIEV